RTAVPPVSFDEFDDMGGTEEDAYLSDSALALLPRERRDKILEMVKQRNEEMKQRSSPSQHAPQSRLPQITEDEAFQFHADLIDDEPQATEIAADVIEDRQEQLPPPQDNLGNTEPNQHMIIESTVVL